MTVIEESLIEPRCGPLAAEQATEKPEKQIPRRPEETVSQPVPPLRGSNRRSLGRAEALGRDDKKRRRRERRPEETVSRAGVAAPRLSNCPTRPRGLTPAANANVAAARLLRSQFRLFVPPRNSVSGCDMEPRCSPSAAEQATEKPEKQIPRRPEETVSQPVPPLRGSNRRSLGRAEALGRDDKKRRSREQSV